MYNSKLVTSIKSNGKILREFKDTVYIPFGSEYSILIKNLNTVRAVVNIFIDGTDVMTGGLVLQPGQEIDLERSVNNSNLNEGNKFKFIERNSAVEQHRGIKLEDGLVRVEYVFEKIFQRQDGFKPYTHRVLPYDWYNTTIGTVNYSAGIIRGVTAGEVNLNTTTISTSVTAQSINDAGITVAGSKSEQKFSVASWFATEAETYSIVLKLLGETEDNKIVTKPITVKTKQKCVTCNHTNKATSKFCSSCGTALEIFA